MKPINEYPEVVEAFKTLCDTRRNELLNDWVNTDEQYKTLCKTRADTSMELNNFLLQQGKSDLLEAYSDAVYAQETYELDKLYAQALHDAYEIINRELSRSNEA